MPLRKLPSTMMLALLLPLGLAGAPAAMANVEPMAAHGNPRAVVFPYDKNNIYEIFARPKAVTSIELPADERLKVLAVGDSTSWEAVNQDNYIFIKPKHENVETTATLVTTKRTYQILLRATHEAGKFYQMVSWEYPGMLAYAASPEDFVSVPSAGVPAAPQGASNDMADMPVDLANANFKYDVTGDDRIRPAQVFDDGTTTYIRIRPGSQDLPALFRVVNGQAELVNYAVRGEWLVVARVMEEMVLKLGKSEVKIRNRNLGSRGWFNFASSDNTDPFQVGH